MDDSEYQAQMREALSSEATAIREKYRFCDSEEEKRCLAAKYQQIDSEIKKLNASRSQSIRCPFCAEPIRPDAIKCKHCGEMLNNPSTVPLKVKDPRTESMAELVVIGIILGVAFYVARALGVL